jgi:hypothetical protein
MREKRDNATWMAYKTNTISDLSITSVARKLYARKVRKVANTEHGGLLCAHTALCREPAQLYGHA